MTMFFAFLEGFVVSIVLIVAIGPQNAYVLRQGIRGRHAVPVATVCFMADASLITLGVLGVGAYIAQSPLQSTILAWGGVSFLLWFALRSIRSAMHPEGLGAAKMDEAAGDAKGAGVRTAMLHAAAFSFLNPWVYMDTMALIGGVSVQYDTSIERNGFWIGAVLASCVWFYGLAFGGKAMAPWFEKPITWRVLDSFIALVMILVAVKLVSSQLGA